MDENKVVFLLDRIVLGLVAIVSMLLPLLVAVQISLFFNLF